MRDLNRCLVLNTVKNYEPLSRRDIAKKLNLSPSSVSNIIDELIKKGFIREIGPGPSQNLGRKPILLEIDPFTWYVIGADLERVTSVKVGITNLKGKLIAKGENFLEDISPSQVVDSVAKLIDRLVNKVKIKRERIIGIGMGTPGLLDQRKGKVIYSVYLGWRDVPLRELIEKKTGLPFIIDTDTNAPALGEQWYGAGKKAESLIYITIGPGVGAGIIINGRVYQGVDGSAGEFGHTVIDPDGPLCGCGNRGCLEALAAEPSLIRWVEGRIATGEKSVIRELSWQNNGKITAEIIYQAVLKKDRLAIEAVRETGRYLGMGVISLVNLLNPQFIIIGGRISRVAQILIQPIKEMVLRYALPIPAQRVKILPAHFGEDAGVIGAATLVLQDVFELPEAAFHFLGGRVLNIKERIGKL
jgi:glucokinase-like ROK family protein